MVRHWAFESQADRVSQRRSSSLLSEECYPGCQHFRSRVREGGWGFSVNPSVFNQALWPEYSTGLVSVDLLFCPP